MLYNDTVPVSLKRGAASGRTVADSPHTGTVDLTGLEPGWLIRYEVFVDDRPVRAQSPQIFSLMPPEVPFPEEPDEIAEFSVAFGSCNYPTRIPIQPIWAQVARRRPYAFIFIGDNNYLPSLAEQWEVPEEDARHVFIDAHRTLKNIPGLRDLMASTPGYATWDDHDYGPNNSDRTFRWRDLSLEMFSRYWPNPSAGLPDAPGLFHSFRIADVEFFILDNRYYRDPNEAPDRKTMFGSVQLDWLKRSLEASDATFKVVANGGTSLVNKTRFENWANFGSERDDFLAWVFAEEISGVFFIAGDWHEGVINRLYRSQDKYPLYELLSSNLAVRIIKHDFSEDEREPGNNQWATPPYKNFNFGMMHFHGERGQRNVTLQIIDDLGNTRAELILSESDLKPE